MKGVDRFFDTNVPLYLISGDPVKAGLAEELIAEGGVISVQVLNEFADVARRKYKAAWVVVKDALYTIRGVCAVAPITEQMHDLGLSIAERYQLRVYESLIIAAALQAGCTTLFSEDMQDGQVIERLTIRNPFAKH